jgi:hypothetical protein
MFLAHSFENLHHNFQSSWVRIQCPLETDQNPYFNGSGSRSATLNLLVGKRVPYKRAMRAFLGGRGGRRIPLDNWNYKKT